MVEVLGYDIGGANTKAVLLNTQNGKMQDAKVSSGVFSSLEGTGKTHKSSLSA